MGKFFVSLSCTNLTKSNSQMYGAGKPDKLTQEALLMVATNLTFKPQSLKFVVFFSRSLRFLEN